VRPFLPLAERLGSIFASLTDGLPGSIDVAYEGQLADYDTRILTLAVLKGLLRGASEEPVSYVNAPQLADERGLEVRETKSSAARDYVNLVSLRGGEHSVAGTLAGPRSEPRIVMVDDHATDVPPARHMLVVRNDDTPGMIGKVGTILGEAGVNISNMALGESPTGERALMVLAVNQPVPAEVLDRLRAESGILRVHPISEE
jgi:D-3-phosphoglycerate dehydrogenase